MNAKEARASADATNAKRRDTLLAPYMKKIAEAAEQGKYQVCVGVFPLSEEVARGLIGLGYGLVEQRSWPETYSETWAAW